MTLSLSGDAEVSAPGTELRARISGSFHKTRAPLVGVSVLVTDASGDMAEVTWRIESGVVNSEWLPVSGRRYDDASRSYKDERIAGWQIRLDSVDDSSVGGDPTAITISLQRESAASP